MRHYFQQIIHLITLSLFFLGCPSALATPQPGALSLSKHQLAEQLGWIEQPAHSCGGYYQEAPFISPDYLKHRDKLQITSNQYNIAQHGVSLLEGNVTLVYQLRQIIANKAYLYRSATTGKLGSVYFKDSLQLREPNTLILAQKGYFDITTKANALFDITYRTAIYGTLPKLRSDTRQPSQASLHALERTRRVAGLSAWGQAKKYAQTQPKIYHFTEVSYTTCPPTHSVWQVKAKYLELNKKTGRGSAEHARLLFKDIPVFYTPYLNFPLDSRRKTGFLWPTVGSLNRNNSYSGYYFGLPIYFNVAPQYDTTITPTFYSERGLQLADLFRYLTPTSNGNLRISLLPSDKYFPVFKAKQLQTYQFSSDSYQQAELNRLLNTHNTRSSLSWQHKTRFNPHWDSTIDFNYVSDDYFLEDFSRNLTENTQNQLPQQGEVHYASEHWNFTGRIQAYQTLHPIDTDSVFKNQYVRFPQLILSGDYPEARGGLHYFIHSEATHFDIQHTPGDPTQYPMGGRVHAQPGIELPLNWPSLYLIPRAQLALTDYGLSHTDNVTAKHQNRSLPIFDISSGLYLDRDIHFSARHYQQTLEPQAYYVYVPFRDQVHIPIFDTTVNALSYDQLFIYNRFSGIDRINDANRLSLGLASRILDQESGTEHVRFAVGEIIYFKNRDVTLCQRADACTDHPNSNDNKRRISPVSAILNLNLNAAWSGLANAIWDPQTKQLNNQTVAIQYQRDHDRVINLAFSYVRNGDPFGGIIANSNSSVAGINNENNLKLTDFSISWPISGQWGAVGRWSEDWNTLHFQNLFYGLQYDSCCWAAQFVAGRTFVKIQDNRPQYSNQFYFQLSLKGLGSFNGKGDPTAALKNNIAGYQSRFEQDI